MRGDLTAGPETAIDESPTTQILQNGFIFVEMLGLAAHRPGPSKAKPCQVFEDLRLIFRAATGLVDVLNPQQDLTTSGLGGVPDMESGAGVTKVQVARWRRRKTGHEIRHFVLFASRCRP